MTARSRSVLADARVLRAAERLVDEGRADTRASVEVALGPLPPRHGFAVIAGVDAAMAALGCPLIDDRELGALASGGLIGAELARRLSRPIAEYDVDAMLDGTLAFEAEPVATIEGPWLEAWLVAALFAASLERSTAIASRAARLAMVADGDALIDASSVRALGHEEALAMARAAHIGGANATTHLLAAQQLGIPAWGADDVVELGASGDDEADLVEARRLGGRGPWLATGLVGGLAGHRFRTRVVAIEDGGAWSPHAEEGGLPGRKRLVRYADAKGALVGDVLHLVSERMQSPRSVGAASLAPLARSLVRDGRVIEVAESAAAVHERVEAGRASLPAGVLRLRGAEAYPVILSAGLGLQPRS